MAYSSLAYSMQLLALGDSQMICDAHPLCHDGKRYALYNANSYGGTGVGLAVFDGA